MFARRSLHWILSPIIIAIILAYLLRTPVALILILISIFFMIFFRNPERDIGEGILSPADGRISQIESIQDVVKICTVMGLKDVHVNRAPLEGKVISMEHIPGKHVPAFNKNSEANERLILVLDTKIGKIKIIQIAGAFARRIQPYIKEGDTLSKGQRIGIIRFGSRVDLHLPKDKVRICVETGSKVKAGESTLAKVIANENR